MPPIRRYSRSYRPARMYRRRRLGGLRRRYGISRRGRRVYGRRTLRRGVRRYRRTRGARRGRRGTKVTARAISKAIAPIKTVNFNYGQVNTVPQTSFNATYFTTEIYDTNPVDKTNISTEMLFSVNHILIIADMLWAGAVSRQGPGFNQGNVMDYATEYHAQGKTRYRIRNMSNEPVIVRAYYCKVRKDVYNDTNVYNILGGGFADKTNTGTVNANNIYMTNSTFTPFESSEFTKTFKVTAVRKIRIQPTQFRELYLKKTAVIKPANYTDMSTLTSVAWRARAERYSYIKPGRFILFKMEGQASIPTGQVTFMKNITQTTPSVTLETWFQYKARMLFIQSQTSGMGQTAGVGTGVGQIMGDEDYKVTTETNAG
nr:MAG: capsid protein [Cressdnaviricota sp.]